jgi:hypothetical protein
MHCTGSEQALGLLGNARPTFVQAGEHRSIEHRRRRARGVGERRAGVEEHAVLEAEGGPGVADRGPSGADGGHAFQRALDWTGFRLGFDARIYTSLGGAL